MNTTTSTIRRPSPAFRIPRHLNGPRTAANGGFASGILSAAVGDTATVRLHRKVPLERDLTTGPHPDHAGAVLVADGGRRIATVTAARPFVHEPPARPTLDEAEEARRAHPWWEARHALSDCVVCGPHRRDGLRVTPGPLARDSDVLAAPYAVGDPFVQDGVAPVAAVWGSLDCVSYPAVAMRKRRLALLGSLTVHRVREVAGGEHLVAVGWTTGHGTRSHQTASALLDRDGAVVASARAVWVELRHQRLAGLVGRFR